QCNARDAAGSRFSAFVQNFGTAPAPYTLRLAEGLVPGRYLVESGAADETCDLFPPGTAIASVIVQKRGQGASAELLLPPGLSLVRATRLGPADLVPQRWDLAADPPSVELVQTGGVPLLRLRAHVVNAGSDPSPSTSLRIHGALLDATGAVVTLPGLTPEVLLATLGLPSLAGSSGFTVASKDLSTTLPFGEGIANLMVSGMMLQVRVEVLGSSSEADPLNNDMSAGWSLESIPIVGS
ncbi:MAG TPA: hypothetical protein VK824_01005, partial [Planctomycetota bacterium]|nr:hypothetical protein [Planctomycetota bacterium]